MFRSTFAHSELQTRSNETNKAKLDETFDCQKNPTKHNKLCLHMLKGFATGILLFSTLNVRLVDTGLKWIVYKLFLCNYADVCTVVRCCIVADDANTIHRYAHRCRRLISYTDAVITHMD